MRSSVFVLLILLFIISGCRQQTPTPNPDSGLQIALTVEPATMIVGEVMLVITVTDASGAAMDGAKVSARGDMSHAGMTPVFGETQASENGEYRIPFEWTMAGDWFVEITVTLANGGESVMQRFDLSVYTDNDEDTSQPEATIEAES